MTRLERIQALAWSLADVQPALTRSESSGEVATLWMLCPFCDGEGELFDRFGRATPCENCAGDGRYKVDSVTEERPGMVSDTDGEARRGHIAPCDRCAGAGVRPTRYLGGDGPERCASCEGTGRMVVPFAEDTPSLLGTGLRSRGDWAKVEAALGALRRRDRAAYRAWLAALDDPPPPPSDERGWDSGTPQASTPQPCPCPSAATACLCHDASVRPQDGFCGVGSRSCCPDVGSGLLGLQNPVERANTFLLEVLPGELRVPAGVLTAFRARHDRAIASEGLRAARVFRPRRGAARRRAAELVRAGTPIPVVARELGISERTVERAVAA